MKKLFFDWHLLLIFALAVITGLLYILPPFIVWSHFNASGSSFILAQMETYKDEMTVYLARAREIYDGYFPPSDLYFDEQRPTVLNPLPPLIFSLSIRGFQGNVNLAYLSVQFIFVAVIFILFYALGQLIFVRRSWSFLLAAIGTLTPLSFFFYRFEIEGENVFQNITGLVSIFIKQFVPLVNTPIHKLFLARVDDPLLTYPIFISAFLFFVAFWVSPSFKKCIPAAIFSGLLFYTYFHYWVFWFTFLFCLLLIGLIFKRIDNNKLKHFILFFLVTFIIAMPYFINYMRVVGYSDAKDFTYRFGLAEGRGWSIVSQFLSRYVIYGIFLFITHLFYFRKRLVNSDMFLSLILAMFIVGNLQLITGFMPVPSQVSKPIALVILILGFKFFHDFIELLVSKIGSKRFINLVEIVLIALIFLVI